LRCSFALSLYEFECSIKVTPLWRMQFSSLPVCIDHKNGVYWTSNQRMWLKTINQMTNSVKRSQQKTKFMKSGSRDSTTLHSTRQVRVFCNHPKCHLTKETPLNNTVQTTTNQWQIDNKTWDVVSKRTLASLIISSSNKTQLTFVKYWESVDKTTIISSDTFNCVIQSVCKINIERLR
jgi:hypothetical protein